MLYFLCADFIAEISLIMDSESLLLIIAGAIQQVFI